VQVDAHGSRRETGLFGDLRTGHTLDEAQHERLLIRLRQRAQRGEHLRDLGGTRRGHRNVDELVGRLGRAQMIDGAIARDRHQPARKCSRLGELRQPLERGREHVLDEIRRIAIRDPREHDAVHRAMKALVQLGERAAITATRSAHHAGEIVGCAAGSHGETVHAGKDGPGAGLLTKRRSRQIPRSRSLGRASRQARGRHRRAFARPGGSRPRSPTRRSRARVHRAPCASRRSRSRGP
jgi:hypothetical protein